MQGFEFSVQAALEIFYLLANVLITLTTRKRISLSADSDQMAPPSGLPPPLKSWTKLFTLTLFVLIFLLGALTFLY